jgi:hypothetical protein
MPVLLMARGDQESRTLLRRAIELRYGLGPPVIETLRIEMKGRTRTKLGPVTTWVPLEGLAYFKFPLSIRWNLTLRSVGLSLSRSAEAFDGTTIYRQRNRETLVKISDAAQLESLRIRLWALSAVLLTPLAEHYVQLNATGEHSFEAVNTEIGTKAELSLTNDGALDYVTTDCIHPVSAQAQTYTLQASDGQALFGGLILPRKLAITWDNEPEMEIVPVAADINQPVADTVFTLESD